MADQQNKKIKLPQHLQIDSVSPATRLLEKRRLMYEVQKAFEDQKEDFHNKEKRFKLQEAELREKDILIQDNLIKFSTYLQQQELRKNKDEELRQNENQKIEQLESEIQKRKHQLALYKKKAEKIEKKVEQMKKYERFLEIVKEQNPDEFQELGDILSRYRQLDAKQTELHNKQRDYTDQFEKINNELVKFQSKMKEEQTVINNRISGHQKDLERVEKEKNNLLAQRDESTAQKSSKIKEMGQILMTIENLYEKCQKNENVKTVQPTGQQAKHPNRLENFDDFDEVQVDEKGKKDEKLKSKKKPNIGEIVADHLEIVVLCMRNYIQLKKQYVSGQL